MNGELTGINIALADVYTLYRDVLPNEFANSDSECFQGPLSAPTSICNNPDSFIFLDNIHPTSATHSRIADISFAVLDNAVKASVDEVFIFGDSLSDRNNFYSFSNGFVPPTVATGGAFAGTPLYSPGAFTDNLLWWEHLINDLGVSSPVSYYDDVFLNIFPTDPTGGINFAVSGATSGQDNAGNAMNPPFPIDLPGLEDQVTAFTGLFAPAQQANSDALYIIWVGTNNLLGAFSPVTPDNPFAPFSDFTTNAQQPVDDIAAAITILHELGARNFLIGNLFDLGDTRLAAEFEAIRVSTPEPSATPLITFLAALGLGTHGVRKSLKRRQRVRGGVQDQSI